MCTVEGLLQQVCKLQALRSPWSNPGRGPGRPWPRETKWMGPGRWIARPGLWRQQGSLFAACLTGLDKFIVDLLLRRGNALPLAGTRYGLVVASLLPTQSGPASGTGQSRVRSRSLRTGPCGPCWITGCTRRAPSAPSSAPSPRSRAKPARRRDGGRGSKRPAVLSLACRSLARNREGFGSGRDQPWQL